MTQIPAEDLDEVGSSDPADRSRERRRNVEYLAVCTALLVLLFFLRVLPNGRVALNGWENYPLPESCGSKVFFNTPCPACGLTRSMVHLSHGDVGSSLRFHRLGGMIFGLLLVQLPYRAFRIIKPDRAPSTIRVSRWLTGIIVAAFVANWLIP